MDVALVTSPPRRRNEELRALGVWLLCWIALPSLAFLPLSIIGGPPRFAAILAAGAVGLVVRKKGFAVKMAAFGAVFIYSACGFLANMFNLTIGELAASSAFLMEIRPAQSAEYVAMAGLMILTFGAAWRLLMLPSGFTTVRSLLAAVAAVFTLTAIDLELSAESRGSYGRVPDEQAVPNSAVTQTRFGAPGTGQPHLVIIVVEAMGLPRQPALNARLFPRVRAAGGADRYTVATGSTLFFQSTTSAEVRELCGSWRNYRDWKERSDPGCLPARLGERGYQSIALHGFEKSFFRRDQWYPNIGFDELLFRDELIAQGAGRCSGVFPGACDRDIPALIGKRLIAAKQPQFIYWLTLNTHFPVPADPGLGTSECDSYDAGLAARDPMMCRMFSLWSEIDASLAGMISNPKLPPTDILIVGDHMPPFFDRESRLKFDAERVPWILLRHRPEAIPDVTDDPRGPTR